MMSKQFQQVRKIGAALVALIAMAGAAPAIGQDTNYSIIGPTFWTDQLPVQMLANDMARREERNAATDTPAPPPIAAAVTTAYDVSPAVTRRVRNQFIDFVAGIDGRANAEQLRAVFDQNDPVAVWSEIVREDGLGSGDAVDAVTAYWILNWIMANQGDSDRTLTLAARRQMRPSWRATPLSLGSTKPSARSSRKS